MTTTIPRSVLPPAQHLRTRRDGACWRLILCAWGVVVALAGCQRGDEIRRYTVEKLPQSDAGVDDVAKASDDSAQTDRMIGAMVPKAERAWFFKITGPEGPVSEQMQKFLEFMGSLRFADGPAAEPAWTLPEGWTERPGSGMRHATIQIATTDPPLEMSVIQLPHDGGDEADYLLANLNRWRGQLGLPPVAKEAMFETSETEEVLKVPVDGGEATLVNLVGRLGSTPMRGGPFAAPFARPPVRDTAAASPPTSGGLTYDSPEGWKSTPASGMRRAAFTVESDGQTAEMTVIVLPGTAGGLLANVNRWRDQIGLQPLSEEELANERQAIEVNAQPGQYVQFDGPDSESILGVILQQPEQSWYFKLKGDRDLVRREQARFEEFIRSVKLQ